jgi:hypothetical protein
MTAPNTDPEFLALQTEVAADVSVMGSAKTLIDGFAARLQGLLDASNDDASLRAGLTDITAGLNTASTALAASVAANTPAAPTT